MSVFVLSDPHLCTSHADKSMEAFGNRWQNYIQRIESNWRAVVDPDDTVVLPGDISWAMNLGEALGDFTFLNALPGKKLIGKGNHDFYWTTAAKMYRFFNEHHLDSLRILYNNAYVADGMILCGTRGWFNDPSLQKTVGEVDYRKIVNREVLRLRLSLNAAVALNEQNGTAFEIVPFLHFPPVWADFRCEELLGVLREFGVRRCYFGHIHSGVLPPEPFVEDGVRFILCAADHLKFTPYPVFSPEKFR